MGGEEPRTHARTPGRPSQRDECPSALPRIPSRRRGCPTSTSKPAWWLHTYLKLRPSDDSHSLHSVHLYSHVVRRTRIDPDTTSTSTCTYYTTCTYVYAPDPWAVAGLLWQICFHCMIKPRPKSLLRCNSHENWHSISDWCHGSVNSASIPEPESDLRNHCHSHCLPIKINLSQPWPVLACVTLQVSCSEEKKKTTHVHVYSPRKFAT